MICKEFLSVNIKELINTLSHKNFNLSMSGENDPQLEETLQVLELCLDAVEKGIWEDDNKESGYNEGWDDAIDAVTSLLDSKGVSIPEIEDL